MRYYFPASVPFWDRFSSHSTNTQKTVHHSSFRPLISILLWLLFFQDHPLHVGGSGIRWLPGSVGVSLFVFISLILIPKPFVCCHRWRKRNPVKCKLWSVATAGCCCRWWLCLDWKTHTCWWLDFYYNIYILILLPSRVPLEDGRRGLFRVLLLLRYTRNGIIKSCPNVMTEKREWTSRMAAVGFGKTSCGTQWPPCM